MVERQIWLPSHQLLILEDRISSHIQILQVFVFREQILDFYHNC